MASLEEVYQTELRVEEIKDKMLHHFHWTKGEYLPELMADFEVALDKMYKRNEKFLGENYIKNNLN